MPLDPVSAYGLRFPPGTPAIAIERHCALVGHSVKAGGLGKAGHFKNFIRLLWPEKLPNGQTGYVWHDWSDERFDLWCAPTSTVKDHNETIMVWWGASGTGKSTDAAVCVLADYYLSPTDTTTLVCSTDLPTLRRRIFGEVLRFHYMIEAAWGKKAYGDFSEKRCAICTDAVKYPKAGIWAIPVKRGTVEETRNYIVGQHNTRVRIVVDEAQETREAVYQGANNIRTGASSFIQLSMGNPDGWLNPLGQHSEPIAGRNSIHPDRDHKWATREGICVFFDGRKSPGIRDPKKFPFLLNQNDFDETKRIHGENSAIMWRERIGFVQPAGMSRSIIPESMILDGNAMKDPVWASAPTPLAACDPAFSGSGNRCIFVPGLLGRLTSGHMAVGFLPWQHIQINIDFIKTLKGGLTEYLSTEISNRAKALGVAASALGLDCTGSLIGDEVARRMDGQIHRVINSEKPTERVVSDMDGRPAYEVYRDRASELWWQGLRFFSCDAVRGISNDAARELSQREPVPNVPKLQAESKKDLMARLCSKESPDVADAHLILLDVAVNVLGFYPNPERAGEKQTPAWADSTQSILPQMSIDNSDDNYLTFSL